jgi:hypothetical protein
MIPGYIRQDAIFYVIGVFILLVCLKIYSESEVFTLKCIISGVDGNKYCVRNRLKLKEAADLLATVTAKAHKFVKDIGTKHPSDERVKRLVKGFDPKKVQETLPTSELTAFSENKGEKLAFCLARTKHSEHLIDENTLIFVYIHELAHIATKSIGHKKEFWDNFKFLLEEAKETGFYSPVDYKKDNQTYCGMTITDNPYYDM